MSDKQKYIIKSPLLHNGKRYESGTITLTAEEARIIGPVALDLSGMVNDATIAAGAGELATKLKTALETIGNLTEQLTKSEEKCAAAEKISKEFGKQVADLIKQRDELIGKLEAATKKSGKK